MRYTIFIWREDAMPPCGILALIYYYALKIRTTSDLKVTVGKIRFDYLELRNMWGRKHFNLYSSLQVPLPDTQTPLVEYKRTRKNSVCSIQ